MKFSIQISFCILILLFSSCSTHVQRYPAETTHDIFNQTFSFLPVEKAGIFDNTDVVKKIILTHFNESHFIDYVEVESLPNGALFKVELERDPATGMKIYRIFNTPEAFKDTTATYAMLNFVVKLGLGEELGTSPASFEMYHNAKAGDPIALDNFLKIRSIEWKLIEPAHTTYWNSPDYLKSQQVIKSYRAKLDIEIKALKQKRSIERTKRKMTLDALDKAPEGKQFRSLIAKNDRQGVAALLKKYLPWEEMPPFEKQFWETYLEILVNPVPLDQRVIIYRGLNEDYIHRASVAGKELSEKEAILQDKAFVMSSGMVKNQGSWNRRLRSLEAMNEKYIATVGGNSEYSKSARISVMFFNHAVNPQGSPFISLTPNVYIAEQFGSERLSSFLIDPRLLNFNYASIFEQEVEYLIPLTTFPDELVGISDTNLSQFVDGNSDPKQFLEEKLVTLISKNYGKEKKDEIINKIKKNTHQFFQRSFPSIEDPKGPPAGPSNLKFYKKFLTKDDPKPTISPSGELQCKDLIELFWKAK